jgi:hypothetical protein
MTRDISSSAASKVSKIKIRFVAQCEVLPTRLLKDDRSEKNERQTGFFGRSEDRFSYFGG